MGIKRVKIIGLFDTGDGQVMDVMNVAEFIFMAGTIYGAIRLDIRNIHEKIAASDRSITRAHERIDGIMSALK